MWSMYPELYSDPASSLYEAWRLWVCCRGPATILFLHLLKPGGFGGLGVICDVS